VASGLKTFLQVYFKALPPIGSNIAAEAGIDRFESDVLLS
jgi:hypothetical protein